MDMEEADRLARWWMEANALVNILIDLMAAGGDTDSDNVATVLMRVRELQVRIHKAISLPDGISAA